MAGENIQFEEVKINCVQNFKKRFGFWGGSMAGENVEFEEG